jgi:hypothetical protein
VVTERENALRRYLLGDLPEVEQDALEELLMTNDETFRQLLIAEDELVDDFCDGELNDPERHLFLTRFLITDERRYQLRFGAALRNYVSASGGTGKVAAAVLSARVWWRLFAARPIAWRLAAAVLTASVVGGLWMFLMTGGPEYGDDTRAQITSVFLTSGRFRTLAEPPQSFVVPPGTDVVELQLDLPSDDYVSYGILVERNDGVQLHEERSLTARVIGGYRVIVTGVPASLLEPGDYQVIVRGVTGQATLENVGRYEFRVLSP